MSENNLKKCLPIEIPDDNPFQNDVLNRKDNIETLTTFITSFEQSIVLCIDGGWGQGKTTFIRMWEKYLHQQSIPTIYFNAWESDYTDDALIALIGEIGLSIDKMPKENEEKSKGYLSKLMDKLGYLATHDSKKEWLTIFSAFGSFCTGGKIKVDKIVEFTNNLGACLAKEQIERYEKSKQVLTEFKDLLSKLTECYSTNNIKKPLVIFIDELDRCRPNFAIEVLEKAKHLFNVDNIIFVLATDKSQLAHSIRAVYGQGLDVNGYLRRFIDFDYLLPTLDKNNFFINLLQKFSLDQILQNLKFYNLNTLYNSEYTYLDFSYDLINLYQLTLREQEAICNILNIALRTRNPFDKSELTMLLFLIILKIKVPDIYKTFSKDSMSIFKNLALENVQSHFTLVDTNRLSKFPLLESLLLIASSSTSLSLDTPIVQNYINKYNLDEVKKTALEKCFEELGYIRYKELLELKKTIEFSVNFKFQ